MAKLRTLRRCYNYNMLFFISTVDSFDLNFKEDDGAARALEVAEDVKTMCRGKLRY